MKSHKFLTGLSFCLASLSVSGLVASTSTHRAILLAKWILNDMRNIYSKFIYLKFYQKAKPNFVCFPLQACPFVINIYAERCKPRIKAIHMEACSGQLEKAICKSVLDRSDAKVMDGYENIIVHTCNYDTWITSIIENKVSIMN